MRQPDNLPAFCRVHRNGRPLIGYLPDACQPWVMRVGAQIARSGGTDALAGDQVGAGAEGGGC